MARQASTAVAVRKSTDFAHYEHASASLLAMEPAEAPPEKPKPSDDWPEMFAHCEARLTQMRNWRLSWWRHWALIAEYVCPRRYHWLITPNTMTRGEPINQAIVDSTGTRAKDTCAAGMMSGLCSPSRPWFTLKPRGFEELDRDAKVWIDDVVDRMEHVMAGSNFYQSMAQMHEDNVAFGTAPVIIYEHEDRIIHCYNPCAGEYYLAVGADFRPQTLYRQFVLTAHQIVDMFGLENCPYDIQEMWRTKGQSMEVERIIAHGIEPNFPLLGRNGKEFGVIKGDFTWREVYWVWGQNTPFPLSRRGFKDCPFIAPRWATTSNDPYGRSIAMTALPDIMSLQVMQRRLAEAVEKMVRPPLIASVELKNEPSSILPGHVTYVSNLSPQSQGMRPIYEVNPQVQEMTLLIKDIQGRINSTFFNDLWMMLENMEGVQPRNQLEIAERKNEKMQVLGPVIENIHTEFSFAIKRIFAIMKRKQLLPPPPPSLQGVPLQIEYVSTLALAQKAASTTAMERVAAIAGNLSKISPDASDNIDSDEFIREYGDLVQVRHKIFRDPKVRDQMRQQRARQMQAAQAAQTGQQVAQGGAAAAQLAQTLSKTEVGGGQSALDLMLGLGNSGGGGAQ